MRSAGRRGGRRSGGHRESRQHRSVRPLTWKQAEEYGERGYGTLYHRKYRNADGTAMRVRISGRPQKWKRDPSRDRVPIKHGLYDHGYLDRSNVHEFSATEPAPNPRKRGYVAQVGYGPTDHVGGAKTFRSKRAAERYAQEHRSRGQEAVVRRA